jgi:hypothetical protein
MQMLAAGSLISMLARRYPLPLTGPAARENLTDLLKPTGMVLCIRCAQNGVSYAMGSNFPMCIVDEVICCNDSDKAVENVKDLGLS